MWYFFIFRLLYLSVMKKYFLCAFYGEAHSRHSFHSIASEKMCRIVQELTSIRAWSCEVCPMCII